jgi:crotonobetainyl-CoA:carnitine CoA-transferase CaiB-like acyl-CoA transferase
MAAFQIDSLSSNNLSVSQPLKNIRVVDLTRIVAGPFTTRILSDLGAEVIKIESIHSHDPLRFNHAVPGGEEGSDIRAPLWNNICRGKKSISLNLWHPDAVEVLKQLITVSDILIENFRPRVMARWGLTYDEVRKLRPDIIYVSISGFGHSGPKTDYTTFGPTAQALSGLTYMSGLPGIHPSGIGFSYLNHFAGLNGALTALAALQAREITKHGQHIDISQVESGAALTGTAFLERVVNNRSYIRPENPPGTRNTYRKAAPEGVYPCIGLDQWCAITVSTDSEWEGLSQALGTPSWAKESKFDTVDGRCQYREELDQHLTKSTISFDKYALMELLQSHGVPAGAVQSPEDRAEKDPQLQHREFFKTFSHPELGIKPTDRLPFVMSASHPVDNFTTPPKVGQDNDHIIRDLLGVSPKGINQMIAEGAI